MDVSKNRGILPPKWMVFISWFQTLWTNGWFGGTGYHYFWPVSHPPRPFPRKGRYVPTVTSQCNVCEPCGAGMVFDWTATDVWFCHYCVSKAKHICTCEFVLPFFCVYMSLLCVYIGSCIYFFNSFVAKYIISYCYCIYIYIISVYCVVLNGFVVKQWLLVTVGPCRPWLTEADVKYCKCF